MLKFKIYAGNMYCGVLSVFPGFSHTFLNRDSSMITSGTRGIKKVSNYKHLRLVRI